MATSEYQSIASPPVRRSLDRFEKLTDGLTAITDKLTSDLADLTTKVTDLTTKVADNHTKSAWGVIGRGSFAVTPNVVMGAGASRNSLTNPLSVTFVNNRFYEVRCVLEAYELASDVDPTVIENEDVIGFRAIANISGIDRGGSGLHTSTVAIQQGATFIWALRCPADVPVGTQSVTILLTNDRPIDVLLFTGASCHFIVQDVGPAI